MNDQVPSPSLSQHRVVEGRLEILLDDLDQETLVWSEGGVLDKNLCKVSVEIYQCITIRDYQG